MRMMCCLQKRILCSATQQQNVAALAKKVSILERALAAGSAAESDDSDTEVGDRLTLHINLWTNSSRSNHRASCLSHVLYFVQCVGLYLEIRLFNQGLFTYPLFSYGT